MFDQAKCFTASLSYLVLIVVTVVPTTIEAIILCNYPAHAAEVIIAVSIPLSLSAFIAGFTFVHYMEKNGIINRASPSVKRCRGLWCGPCMTDDKSGMIGWGGFTITYIIIPITLCNLLGAWFHGSTLHWGAELLAHLPFVIYVLGCALGYARAVSEIHPAENDLADVSQI